ncbi:MAG: hypothetical protein WKF36_04215 [Candidatus Nitrosocosmicus sp.]
MDDFFAQKRIAIVLIPEPIIPAIRDSKRNLENRLGTKELKKLIIEGNIIYPVIPPRKPIIQNIRTIRYLFIV